MALTGPGFTRFFITFRPMLRTDITPNMHWHSKLQVALTGILSVPPQTRVPGNRELSARLRFSDNGRSVQEVLTRGEMVKPRGLHQPMCLSWVWLYRNDEPEQRFVMSNLDLGYVISVVRNVSHSAFVAVSDDDFSLLEFRRYSSFSKSQIRKTPSDTPM